MNIENVKLKKFECFTQEKWDKIVFDLNGDINYSYWFTEYIVHYNQKNNIRNYSTVFYDSNDEVLAIVPLFIETINENNQISIGENAINSPLFNPNLEQKSVVQIYEIIIDYVNELSVEFNSKLARFQIPSLNMQSVNYYKLFGFNEEIRNPDWYIFKCDFSYIITLKNRSIPDIRSKIRKSFKSLINKTKNDTNLIILDKDNQDRRIFDKYIELHYEIKGKNRTRETFEKDYIAICSGLETILICEYQDKFIGAVVLYTFNKKAIYNSAMQKYDTNGLHPNHFLMWESIEYLHKKEYEFFLNGEQVIQSDKYCISEKEKNLSHFKKAWGGELYPWMKVEKLYNVSSI